MGSHDLKASNNMKNDYDVWKKKASPFFNWLVFFLIATFVFIFFSIVTSHYYGFTMLYSKPDLVSLLMALILIVCSAEEFFASNFFLKGNSKKIAVRTICGITFWKNILLICRDTLKLLILALVPGILVGMLLIPVINFVISIVLISDFHISLSFQSIFWIIGILLYVIFWAMILNISFVYRNTPVQMLSMGNGQKDVALFKVGKGIVWGILKKITHIMFFIGPLFFLIYDNSGALLSRSVGATDSVISGNYNSIVLNQILDNFNPEFFICLFLSLYGFMKCLSDFTKPVITGMNKRKINNSRWVIALGLLRRDIRLLSTNLYILLAVYSILVYCLLSATDGDFILLIYITYMALSIFLSITMMIRILDINIRKKRQYFVLNSVGFSWPSIKRIVNSEIKILHILILCFVLFYGCFICLYFLMQDKTNSIWSILLLIFTGIMPYLICLHFIQKFNEKIIGGE